MQEPETKMASFGLFIVITGILTTCAEPLTRSRDGRGGNKYNTGGKFAKCQFIQNVVVRLKESLILT